MTSKTIQFGFSLLCLSCVATLDSQVGPRTTASQPVDIKLFNTSNGIKIGMLGASSPTPVLPAPAAPLEIDGGSAQIQFVIATMNGTTKQTLCTGSPTCAVAVRYKIGKTEKSIYLIRAGGKLVFVTPDKFKADGQSGALPKGSIVQIEEMGGPSVSFDQDTQLIVDFQTKK